MSAKVESFYSKDRVLLHEHIPLDMPFTFHIEVSSACDLKCKFCAHSSKEFLSTMGHVFENMSDNTFQLILNQLKKFPQPMKTIWLSGLGEGLLHPKLPEMIKALKQNNLTERVCLITNGIKLNQDLSKALVESGLDSMTISVNGLSSQEYLENCKVKIDFIKYVSEIMFLFANKGKMELNIKIVDCFIKNEQDKELFYKTFGNYCDRINIEKIFPRYGSFSYEGLIKDERTTSRYAEIEHSHRRICSAPFFRMFVTSTGRVNCCGYPDGVASEDMNVYKRSLSDIWSGSEHKEIMLNTLTAKFEGYTAVCATCGARDCYAFEQDNLDPYAQKLYEKILG